MKCKLLLVLFVLYSGVIYGQQSLSYSYDSSGNRIERSIVLSTRNLNGEQNSKSYFFEVHLGKAQMKIYPNPVKSILTVQIAGLDNGQIGECQLFNAAGALLHKTQITEEYTTIDMTVSPQGNYILVIIFNGEKTTWKVIKE